MNNIEIDNSLNNNIDFSNHQKNFIETKFGNIINSAVNIGLKYVLPDLIENDIIKIKDEIIKSGFSSGIKKAIDSTLELGKSTMGIITGNFENINQVQNAIKKRWHYR